MKKTFNILWIVNIILPYPSKIMKLEPTVFGGWLVGLSDTLKNYSQINLAISTIYSGDKFIKCNDGKVTYYVIPKNNIAHCWLEIVNEFNPDLVHIHGSEYPYGLSFQKSFPLIKTVVSLQGIMQEYSKCRFGGISQEDIAKCFALKSFLIRMVKSGQSDFFLKGTETEKETINNSVAVIGRTAWDKRFSVNHFPTKLYYHNDEILRKEFYNKEWNYQNIDKNSIMFSNASSPIKGFHIMLDALSILKDKYPNIKIYVSGPDIYHNNNPISNLINSTDYQCYLKKKIHKLGLKKHLVFTGTKDAGEMCELFLKTNVYVQCSSIENSSNALCEAMILGMPCVASNVGGTSSILSNNEGLLYDFNDVISLVDSISFVFDNPNKAVDMGKNARKKALYIHDSKKISLELINIYKDVICS